MSKEKTSQGKIDHLITGLFSRLNRVRVLSKRAKIDIHKIVDDDLSEQEVDMAHAEFRSKIEQMELNIKELKQTYNTLNNIDELIS